MGGLLHLVQLGGAWVGGGPTQSLFAVPNVTAHPSTASVPITVLLWWQVAPRFQCGDWKAKMPPAVTDCRTLLHDCSNSISSRRWDGWRAVLLLKVRVYVFVFFVCLLTRWFVSNHEKNVVSYHHETFVTFMCSQRVYLLKVLREQGLFRAQLHTVQGGPNLTGPAYSVFL